LAGALFVVRAAAAPWAGPAFEGFGGVVQPAGRDSHGEAERLFLMSIARVL